MKNGGKNKSVAFIILFSVYIYIKYISNKYCFPLSVNQSVLFDGFHYNIKQHNCF